MSERKFAPEMVKLRSLLDTRGIPWEENSDPYDFYTKYGISKEAMQRTKFDVDGEPIGSVIYGYGSYGHGTGLLEAYMPGDDEPQGSLSAEAIVEAWFGQADEQAVEQ